MLAVLSLLLHAAAFYFIILLFSKYSGLKAIEKEQRQLLEETEQLLAGYMMEIKDENEKMLREISFPQEPRDEEIQVTAEREPNSRETEEEELPAHLKELVLLQEKAETAANPEDSSLSPMGEVEMLSKQGFSAEEIARKLGRGKTEIQLMMKFGQK